MVSLNPLASTLLMGVFLLVIVAGIAGLRRWQHEEARPRTRGTMLSGIARSPQTWIVVFGLVVVALVGGSLLYVGGLELPSVSQGAVWTGLVALLGLVFLVFVFLGIYDAARSRGLKASQAAGVSSMILGMLLVVAIVWSLLG